MLLKGALFNEALRPDVPHGLSMDVDFWVAPDHADAVRSELVEMGFSHDVTFDGREFQRVSADVVRAEDESRMELFPFMKFLEVPRLVKDINFIRDYLGPPLFNVRGDKVFLLIKVDVHKRLHHKLDLPDEWSGLWICELRDRKVSLPSPELAAWFLASRLYHDITMFHQRKIKSLADLALLFSRSSIDYSRLLELTAFFSDFAPGVFYVFHFLMRFMGIEIPSKDLDDMSRHALRSPLDYGDFVPRLLASRTPLWLVSDPESALEAPTPQD